MTGVSIPLDDDPPPPTPPPGFTGCPRGLFRLPAIVVVVVAVKFGPVAFNGATTGAICGLCNGVVVATDDLIECGCWASAGGRITLLTPGVVGVEGFKLPSGLDMGTNVVAAAVLTICGEFRIKFW